MASGPGVIGVLHHEPDSGGIVPPQWPSGGGTFWPSAARLAIGWETAGPIPALRCFALPGTVRQGLENAA
jgi:hypothetical protein